MESVIIKNLAELKTFAEKVRLQLEKPALILLEGELGTGKTAFVKKFAEARGLSPRIVKSPTFSLINRYKTSDGIINHLDLYRLENPDRNICHEISELTQDPSAQTFIEWGERLPDLHNLADRISLYKIKFDLKQDQLREISFEMLSIS